MPDLTPWTRPRGLPCHPERALLRRLPEHVNGIGFAARYQTASRAASVGGDLYEVADSPYGVRLVVGDVRGKGLEAVHMASTVVAAFRRAAFSRRSLLDVAADVDAAVAAVADPEDFVTAVFVELGDNTVTTVDCGHHPPLLVACDGSASFVDTAEPDLPLGLGPTPHPVTSDWPADGRLLLYTDGLVEARDQRGRYFPLVQHAGALVSVGLDEALDALLGRRRSRRRTLTPGPPRRKRPLSRCMCV